MTPAPNLNPSPKQRFLQLADSATKHREMVQSLPFQRASDFAMLQYASYLNQTQVDGQGAAANHFKLRGAEEFLQTLRLLSEVPQVPKVLDKDNLPEAN